MKRSHTEPAPSEPSGDAFGRVRARKAEGSRSIEQFKRALKITTASQGLRPAFDVRASGGRRQTASSRDRKSAQGTIAFSFTSGSAFASSPA